MGDKLFDAVVGEVEKLVELGAGEGGFFGGALDFDDKVVGGHDDVEVDGGVEVEGVVEVESRLVIDEADADGGDLVGEDGGGDGASGDEGLESLVDGEPATGDGGGASAPIGLEDIAVDDNLAGAELFEVNGHAEATADEAGDFLGTSFGPFLFTLDAGLGTAGEEGVFGGEPAVGGVLLAEPRGETFFEGGITENVGIAKFGEDGALGPFGEA